MTYIQIDLNEEEAKIVEKAKHRYGLNRKDETIKWMVNEIFLAYLLKNIQKETDKLKKEELIQKFKKQIEEIEKKGNNKFAKSEFFKRYKEQLKKLIKEK